MDFRELFQNVRNRRRMYLLDDRYMTLVGFVTGCDAATAWRLLNGFNDWLADNLLGKRSSLHWSTVIVAGRARGAFDEPQVEVQLSPEQEQVASDDLLEMLDQFLSRPTV